MRINALVACAALLTMVAAVPVISQPASGTLWEIGMQMEGMPDMGFALPKQQTCMSRDTSDSPPAKDDCEILEQKSTGNRHWMKMQCPDGLMEMDQTRTASTLNARMKMTDASGEVMNMTMTGKATGDCDYAATQHAQQQQVQQIEAQVADAQRQGAAAQRQADAQIAASCTDALARMQGQMIVGTPMCAAQKTEYCRRLNTLDGFQLVAAQVPRGYEADPHNGYPALLGPCGLDQVTLVRRYCPEAASHGSLEFVRNNCPAERAQLVAQHCAGRKYSSQIDARYRNFCGSALSEESMSNDGSAAPATESPDSPAKQGVKKGVKDLKKVFGF